jgi:ribosomal-protein-alanine N-acetyltransferase
VTAIEIVTPRLVLRDFTPTDEAAFIAYQSDPTFGHELVARFEAWRRATPRLNFQLAVCRRDAASTLIGCCGLRRESLPSGVAEFGLELAPSWQGRYRYALEITEAMLGFGFETLGLDEIMGRTAEANERVHRLARWYGATLASREEGKVLWRFSRSTWRPAMHDCRRGRRSGLRSPG